MGITPTAVAPAAMAKVSPSLAAPARHTLVVYPPCLAAQTADLPRPFHRRALSLRLLGPPSPCATAGGHRFLNRDEAVRRGVLPNHSFMKLFYGKPSRRSGLH